MFPAQFMPPPPPPPPSPSLRVISMGRLILFVVIPLIATALAVGVYLLGPG
jgi:uncharacterized membrane protein